MRIHLTSNRELSPKIVSDTCRTSRPKGYPPCACGYEYALFVAGTANYCVSFRKDKTIDTIIGAAATRRSKKPREIFWE